MFPRHLGIIDADVYCDFAKASASLWTVIVRLSSRFLHNAMGIAIGIAVGSAANATDPATFQ